MNYFELYPGDYLRDTTRLSLVDHGAYLRLLMAYYAEEKPLPADESELFVIVSAVSAADKAAVRKVAARFFPVGDDGQRRNGRADEEIAKAQRRIEVARQNGARNRPSKNPPGNPPGMPVGSPLGNPDDHPDGTQRHTQSGEALHMPHATKEIRPSLALTESPATPTEAGRACLLMRTAGCVQVNPSHPDLLAAIAEGATPEVLRDTVAEGISAGKTSPFLWAIATARSRHATGVRPIQPGATHADRSRGSDSSAVARVARRNAEADAVERARANPSATVVEGEFARVGRA